MAVKGIFRGPMKQMLLFSSGTLSLIFQVVMVGYLITILIVNSTDVSLLQIAVHEIGHALGLDHSMRRDAIMHAIYSYKPALALTDDDKLGAQAIYGMCAAIDIIGCSF